MKLDEVRRDGKSKGTSDDGDVRRLFQSGYGVSCDPSENTFFPGSDDSVVFTVFCNCHCKLAT